MNNELTQKTEAQGGEGVLQNLENLIKASKKMSASSISLPMHELEKIVDIMKEQDSFYKERLAEKIEYYFIEYFFKRFDEIPHKEFLLDATDCDVQIVEDNKISALWCGELHRELFGDVIHDSFAYYREKLNILLD